MANDKSYLSDWARVVEEQTQKLDAEERQQVLQLQSLLPEFKANLPKMRHESLLDIYLEWTQYRSSRRIMEIRSEYAAAVQAEILKRMST
jgi:hypothetical protein